ncbi:MAG TPA: protein kinase [Thermomicrobiaceae bacterium]|nr:protein kinase [Thermomicrobiaceae bacterium]
MPARILNGRYRLDEPIGEGGMAIVYRGYDLLLNRPVAIKVLRDQFGGDANFLARFEREAQSAARLAHPNIVSVYDVGEDRQTRYIVMEYIPGRNLKELIDRQGPFSVEGASFVIRQVAAALDYAHLHGLIHRDIKPQNILVDDAGNVKVVDFGIAKGMSDSSLTEAGTGMGTVHYVSPEQARGQAATPASDIYATGVVLFEMLTRELPFAADTPVGIAMQHVAAEPPPPSTFNPAIPEQVDQIVLCAMAKDPNDRFETAGEMAGALGSWDQLPITSQLYQAAAGARTAVAPRPASRRPMVAGRGGRGGRDGAIARGRQQQFRDDVGCVTWLIGIAILIGLIGLVVLGFKLGDFTFLQAADSPSPTAGGNPAVIATPTKTPTPTPTPSPVPTKEITPKATPTKKPSPKATPKPTPTKEPTPTPVPSPSPTPSPTPTLVTIPTLQGATLAQAKAAAANGQFQIASREVYSQTVPAGEIVDQSPAAGTPAEAGSQIKVTVSLGPQFVNIPNLAGSTEAQAQQQLSSLGLGVKVVNQPSSTVTSGLVISTDPSKQASNGATVTVYVSVGNQIQVPNEFGKPLQTAVADLQAAGLRIASASSQSCAYIRSVNANFNCQTFPNGAIVSADLQWGSWVPSGSSINIAYYDANAQ